MYSTIQSYCYIETNLHEFYSPFLYTAIIIEPRPHKALQFVVKNICENLDNDWEIVICHGTKNIDFVNNIKYSLPNYSSRIRLHMLSYDNITLNQYNSMLKSISFYDIINTEIFLIFQTDTMIFSENKHKIYDFMKYDYSGAPWIYNKEVGNGGLSLRRKSKMLNIIKMYSTDTEHKDVEHEDVEHEDVFFSKHAQYKPSYEKALEFSIETDYYDSPFGCHKCWDYLHSNMDILYKRYPDLKLLVEYNS